MERTSTAAAAANAAKESPRFDFSGFEYVFTQLTEVDDMVELLDQHLYNYLYYLVNDDCFTGNADTGTEIYNLRLLRDAIRKCRQ